jgi:osmotically-inducible protein OsmY
MVRARRQLQGADGPDDVPEADGLDDTILEARVRAQLGHAVSQSGAIQVAARHGRVTLSGHVAPGAAEKLRKTVASVPGVIAVVNHLDVQPAQTPGWHDGNPVR